MQSETHTHTHTHTHTTHSHSLSHSHSRSHSRSHSHSLTHTRTHSLTHQSNPKLKWRSTANVQLHMWCTVGTWWVHLPVRKAPLDGLQGSKMNAMSRTQIPDERRVKDESFAHARIQFNAHRQHTLNSGGSFLREQEGLQSRWRGSSSGFSSEAVGCSGVGGLRAMPYLQYR